MGRLDNYPDDIRCYDKHPGSPFYVDHEGDAAEEFQEEWSNLFTWMDGIGFPTSVESEQDPTEGYWTHTITSPDHGACAVDVEDLDAFAGKIHDEPNVLERFAHFFGTGDEDLPGA